MNEKRRTYKMRVFMSVSLVLVCSTLLVVNAVSRQDQGGWSIQPDVKAYVRAFKVEGIEAKDDSGQKYWVLQLRNASAKPISAYTYSMGPAQHPTGRDEIDGLIVGKTIAPGAAEEIRLSDRSLAQSAKYTPPYYKPTVNIEAVVFDDGSVEGNAGVITTIKDKRRGERLQLKRICALLKRASEAPDPEFEASVKSLDSQVAALSDEPGAGESRAVGWGLNQGKQSALTLIRMQYDVTRPQTVASLRQNLDSIIKESEEWLARFEKFEDN